MARMLAEARKDPPLETSERAWLFSYLDLGVLVSRAKSKFLLFKSQFVVLYFSSSSIWMSELDQKEGWALKNWCFLTVVLEKTLESPLDGKEIKPVNPKGNKPWICSGRTVLKLKLPIFRPPNTKNWFIGKDSDAGKDWRWEEKEAMEDETVS